MTYTFLNLLTNVRVLGDAIVEEVKRKGGKAFICNTPVVSDGETQVLDIHTVWCRLVL